MVNFSRMTARRSCRLSCGENVVGMSVDLHTAPDFKDLAVYADQNRGAKDALEGPAIHGFFAPGAIRLQHLMLLIRRQRDRKLMLVPKGFGRLERVTGHTDDGGSGRRKG